MDHDQCAFVGLFRAEKQIWILSIALLLLILISMTLAVSIGTVSIPAHEVWSIAAYKIGLFPRGDWSQGRENIVWLIRFPRVLLAVFVGGGLAIVGVTLQSLVRNPLADSYVLGVSSGASVGAVLAIEFSFFPFLGSLEITIAAFLFSMLSFGIVFVLSNVNGRITPTRLILAGIGVGYVFTGITSFITITSDNRRLAGEVLAWTLGSLTRASWFDITLPSLILALSMLFLLLQSRSLNSLSIGDETAATLGVNVHVFRVQLFTLTALLTGVIVAVSGTIGFIGLMIPHIVRFMVGADHRRVLPISVLAGSLFLIWVDVIARAAFAPIELPVGVITSLLGGPFFLWLMWRNRRDNEGSWI